VFSLPIRDRIQSAIAVKMMFAAHMERKGGTMPRLASDSPAINPT
jgi:hypothetical protein